MIIVIIILELFQVFKFYWTKVTKHFEAEAWNFELRVADHCIIFYTSLMRDYYCICSTHLSAFFTELQVSKSKIDTIKLHNCVPFSSDWPCSFLTRLTRDCEGSWLWGLCFAFLFLWGFWFFFWLVDFSTFYFLSLFCDYFVFITQHQPFRLDEPAKTLNIHRSLILHLSWKWDGKPGISVCTELCESCV